MRGAAGSHSATIIAAEDEGELLLAWNDGDTLRLIQQVMRDALIRRVHNFLEDIGSSSGASDIVLSVGGSCELSCKYNYCGENQKSLQHNVFLCPVKDFVARNLASVHQEKMLEAWIEDAGGMDWR